MKRVLLFVPMLMAVLLTGCLESCTSRSGDIGRPRSPQSSPTDRIVKHSAQEAQAASALDKLNTDRNTLRSHLNQWHNTPGTSGPSFGGEASSLTKLIVEECDRLESEANELKRQKYVREYKGAGPKLDDLIRFARKTRDEVSGR